MIIARENIPWKHRVAYLVLYSLLVLYPMHRIFHGIGQLPTLYSFFLTLLSLLVVASILYTRSELVILYYVIVAIFFKLFNVVEPSTGEFILYSLIILHGDMIARILVYGIGYRRIKSEFKGLLLLVIIFFSLLMIHLVVTYYTTSLFIELSRNVVESNVLTRIVFGKILSTRFGSVFLLVIVTVCVLYVLTHYLLDIVVDVLSLNREYVLRYVRSSIASLWKLISNNQTWHQKLFFRVSLLFILSFIWIFVLPVYSILAEYIPLILGPQLYLLSFATSFLLTAIIYSSMRRVLSRLLAPRVKLELPQLKLEKPSDAPVFFSIALLAVYITTLLIYYRFDYVQLLDTFLRVLGVGKPIYDPYLDSIVRFFEDTYLNISHYFVDYCEKYVSYLVSEFEWVTGLIKSLIKLLWGR